MDGADTLERATDGANLTATINSLLERENPAEHLTKFVQEEINAALTENLTSASEASVATTRSSRKRSRELAWCDVLLGTGIAVPSTEFNTPNHFVEMDQLQQAMFLRRIGLNSREEGLLRTKIKEALKLKSIPSPSSMTWADVPAILHGHVPSDTSLQDPPHVSSSEFGDAVILSIIETMKKKFRRVSEMEVVVRVFLMVMIAVSGDCDIWVELQPSVPGHSTFTDFLIRIRSGDTKRFIEVKRTNVNVDLTSATNETAQALREAQILLCTEKVKSPMPFLLTNGTIWSFGSAAKHSDTKIELTHVGNVMINTTNLSDWTRMINYLRAFLCGTWPPT